MFRSPPFAQLAVFTLLALLLGGCDPTTPTQMPDFAYTITPVADKPQPGTGDVVVLSFSVVNNYFQDFSGMPYSVFDLSSSTPAAPIFTNTVTGFGPGVVLAETATLPAPAFPGSHTYRVMLDPQNAVAESDEANNIADITLVYANGDLFFSPPTATVSPANPTDIDNIQLSFVVQYHATSTSAGTLSGVPYSVLADGVTVFSGSLPAMTINSTNFVQTGPLPPIAAGSHVYTITIDPGNQLPETDETNNVLITPPVPVAPSGPG